MKYREQMFDCFRFYSGSNGYACDIEGKRVLRERAALEFARSRKEFAARLIAQIKFVIR